jgi:hypothetical protein
MSVIGTTLKQPRVFAHDAVKLCDLPGCTWRGAKGVKLLTPGSGFITGIYDSWLSTPITTSNAGNGIKIEVNVVNLSGEIDEANTQFLCGWGNAYNVGDVVTINPPTKIHFTGIDNAGTGYPAGGAVTPTTGGTGVGLEVTYTDDGLGAVTSVTIVNEGTGYTDGDVITIEAGNNDATFTIADSQAATFEVEDLAWTPWDYGCPFTSFYMGLQSIKIKDASDANVGKPLYGQALKCEEGTAYDNPLPNLGEANINGEVGPIETQDAFMHKVKYTISCECEEGPCSCEYETPGPGAALYIGYDLNALTVIMESGNKTTYNNIPAGTFMPISALTICDIDAAGEEPPSPEALKPFISVLF